MTSSDNRHSSLPPGGRAELRQVAARLGSREVLADISARLAAGAVTGIVGPNGAGKSTLLRLLAGVLPAAAGVVVVDGVALRELSARRRAQRIALLEQEGAAPAQLSAWDLVMMGRHPHRPRWGPPSAADHAVVGRAMARAGVTSLESREVGALSGGERQRVHLARAVAQEPCVLLLDEPTNHLDVAAQLDILQLTRELAAEGVTVLAALHDLNHALQYCDEVLVLQSGRVVAHGATTAVLTSRLVSQVYRVQARRVCIEGRRLLLFDPPASGG